MKTRHDRRMKVRVYNAETVILRKIPDTDAGGFKGQKIRVQQSPASVEMGTFGAAAAPMGFGEVQYRLSSRVSSTVQRTNRPTQIHGEVAKYYSYNKHQTTAENLKVILKGSSRQLSGIFREAKKIA